MQLRDASTPDMLAEAVSAVEDVAVYIGAASLMTFGRRHELMQSLLDGSTRQCMRVAYQQ